jgi:hypothetical protein
MAVQRYFFVTNWKIEAPLESVWNTIYDVDEWPTWWPCVKSVRSLEPGGSNDIGKKQLLVWKGFLSYKLCFQIELIEKQMPFLLIGRASGELEGTGTWKFFHENGVTDIIHEWHVSTNKPWMNHLAFLLKPVFHWNHTYVMDRGARGLAKKLGAKLLKY